MKHYTWVDKWVPTRNLFPSLSVFQLLCLVTKLLEQMVGMMCLSEGPGRGLPRSRSLSSKSWTNSIKHSAGSSRCPPNYQHSPISHLPWENLKENRKNTDLQTLEPVRPGPTSCLCHGPSVKPGTTVKTTGLSWSLCKITDIKDLPWWLAHNR